MPGKYDNAFPNAQKVQIFEQVDTYIENNHSTEATQQLTQVLTKLRQKYPHKPDAEIFKILLHGFATMPQNNPQNWQRWQDSFSILFAGGVEAAKILIPVAGIPIEVIKRLYEIYNRNQNQLPGA